MTNTCGEIFGEAVGKDLELLWPLSAAFDGTNYSFMPGDIFHALLAKDLADANRVFWTETLGRAHFAAASTIERNLSWVSGVVAAFEGGHFLAFASCLRGLVEATADSIHSLQHVALTLAKHHKDILKCLNGEENGGFRQAPELEEILIHFSHARKLRRSERAPDCHHAKQTRDYVDALQEVPLATDLYEELCRYTHPSAFSVLRYWHTDDGKNIRFFSRVDSGNIADLCERYKPCFRRLFMSAFNPALLTLAVLLKFPVAEFHVRQMDRYSLSEIPAWRDIVELLKHERPGR